MHTAYQMEVADWGMFSDFADCASQFSLKTGVEYTKNPILDERDHITGVRRVRQVEV